MNFPRILVPASVVMLLACSADTNPTAPSRQHLAVTSSISAGPTVNLITLVNPAYEVGSSLIVVGFEPYENPVVIHGIAFVGRLRVIRAGVGGADVLWSDTALEQGTMLKTTTAAIYPDYFEATVVLRGPSD